VLRGLSATAELLVSIIGPIITPSLNEIGSLLLQ